MSAHRVAELTVSRPSRTARSRSDDMRPADRHHEYLPLQVARRSQGCVRLDLRCDQRGERADDGRWHEDQAESRVGGDRGVGADGAGGLKPKNGGEGAADGEVGAEVEPEQERVRVRGWLGGEQHGCRKVVEKHRCDGADAVNGNVRGVAGLPGK